MGGMVPTQPDPKQQQNPAHAIAPASANQTSALSSFNPSSKAVGGLTSMFGGMLNSGTQHYADGTPNVQDSRYQPFTFNPSGSAPIPSDQLAPTITPTGNGFGMMSARPMAPPNPLAPPPAVTIPLNPQHAAGWFDYLTGAASAAQAAKPTPVTTPVTVGGRSAPSPAPTPLPHNGGLGSGLANMSPGANLMGTPAQSGNVQAYLAPDSAAWGTPHHAIGSPGAYTQEQFVNALRGVPASQVFKIIGLSHRQTMQEQAAGQRVADLLSHPASPQRDDALEQLLHGIQNAAVEVPQGSTVNISGQ